MGKRTCEETFAIDINHLYRHGLIERESDWQLSRRTREGEDIPLVRIQCPNLGMLVLHFDYDGEPVTQTVWLDWSNCNYGGGGRPWFHCPGGCGNRRVKLYRRYGQFKCRVCHNLCYESQLEAVKYRGCHTAYKQWARLGYHDGAPDDPPPRPKGMRQITYRRILDCAEKSFDRYQERIWAGLMGNAAL